MTKHTGWTEHADGSHTAKIGKYEVTIHPPRLWNFWRGDHKGVPCHTGPGVTRTISWRGSHSGCAHTVEAAKLVALWTVQNDMTGHDMPGHLYPEEELQARRVMAETVAFVDKTFGEV